MFETVAPQTFQPRSRRLAYETLPLSIAIHALIIGGCLTAALWNVAFPDASPRVSVAYNLTRVPDPPPPPAPPKPVGKTAPVRTAPPPPALLKLGQIVAPTIIPDRIPEVVEPPPIEPPPQPPLTDTAPGDPLGHPEGVLGGDIAGKVHGKVGGIVFPEDGRVHIDRDQKLPMESVEQEFPHYPAEAQKKHLEDQVVVRYVIGTNGRVRAVEIIDHAKEKMFDEAALDAIKRWRFRPMIKDGKAVEVVHELAVNFEIVLR
jgi:protein TonB